MEKHVSRCVNYEFEDVICEIDEVELLAPCCSSVFRKKIANRFARHPFYASFNPGLKKLRLNKSYDLFVTICQQPSDLLSLNAVEKWKERCKTSVCWLAEIWSSKVHKLKAYLKIMAKFDYVLVSCNASVRPVQDKIQRPCSYMLPGVDTIQFCPYPNPPLRCIDVYSLGRKSQVTHQSLLKMAEQRQIFYIYDTFNDMDTLYYKQHRSLIANIAKRSRYFLANQARIDQQVDLREQSEIGYRFLEGGASGTVMIGEPPENEAFRKHFDWSDAVIRMPFDVPHIAEVLADLDSQPERLEEIRRNNVVQSLQRHDWLYRWKAILNIAGLEPRPALISREKRLKKLAEDVKKAHM